MMEANEFKVETKPTLWWVQLSQGSYSDYTEQNHFIRANNKDEAWYLFKKWWTITAEQEEYGGLGRGYSKALDFENEEFRPLGPETNIDLSRATPIPDRDKRIRYGEPWDVDISNLDVIEWNEFRRQHNDK